MFDVDKSLWDVLEIINKCTLPPSIKVFVKVWHVLWNVLGLHMLEEVYLLSIEVKNYLTKYTRLYFVQAKAYQTMHVHNICTVKQNTY